MRSRVLRPTRPASTRLIHEPERSSLAPASSPVRPALSRRRRRACPSRRRRRVGLPPSIAPLRPSRERLGTIHLNARSHGHSCNSFINLYLHLRFAPATLDVQLLTVIDRDTRRTSLGRLGRPAEGRPLAVPGRRVCPHYACGTFWRPSTSPRDVRPDGQTRARRARRSGSRMMTLLPSSRSQPREAKSASALFTVSRDAPTS